MEPREALELVDAHLDGEELSEEEAAALSDWIKEDPQQADDAFRRIFLHTYLRRRMQTLAIEPPGGPDLLETPGELPPMLPGNGDANRNQNGKPRRSWRPLGFVAAGIGIVGVVLGGMLFWQSPALPVESSPFVYEPFDYPGFNYEGFGFPEVPVEGIPNGIWPTEGGLTGLDGGKGFAAPWQENGPLVAVIESDPMAHPLGRVDLRQFGRLRFVDTHDVSLDTQGNQMRTCAGHASDSFRKLDIDAAPENLRDGDQLGADGGTVWLSFLAQSYDGAGDHRYAVLQLGSDDAGLHFGKLDAMPTGNWGIAGLLNGREVNARSGQKSSGESVFVVMRIDFRPGMELATVWLDPDLDHTPTASTSMCQVQVPDFRFDQLTIKARYSTDFDELRLGETFFDVAPRAKPQ